jgi:hypothetical protein
VWLRGHLLAAAARVAAGRGCGSSCTGSCSTGWPNRTCWTGPGRRWTA